MPSNTDLRAADVSWRNGALVQAHAQYSDVVKKDPKNWHAAFQLAWIDTTFGQSTQPQLDALTRSGLTDEQDELLVVLKDWAALVKAGYAIRMLDGIVAEWDISALRGRFSTVTEWEDAGKMVARAKQFGLADACYAEAEALSPETYWDPPAAAGSASMMADQHLEYLYSP